ncbi:MAG: dienelactone hydrolase family protein [Nitriliruptorales bacterium]
MTTEREVTVGAGEVVLPGDLRTPEDAQGLVVFAHGSGSSRKSPRNRHVASILNEAGLATLLFDLLTGEEERDRSNVFDIELLGERLLDATGWVRGQEDLATMPIGYFGSSTGAAAALTAAADLDDGVAAVVSRGGRADMAVDRLGDVRAPTLLIVGGNDTQVLRMNEEAAAHLQVEHEVHVVEGAGHLFEEPGALDAVADRAARWFAEHLAS